MDVRQLYEAGARNFLFLNMPPMELAPGNFTERGPVITDWNNRLQTLGINVGQQHPDANVWHFDTRKLSLPEVMRVLTHVLLSIPHSFSLIFIPDTFLSNVISNPKSYSQTANIANTTQYCADYGSMTKPLDYFAADCGVPLNEYVWVNNLHITATVHEALAAQIAVGLGGKWAT